MQHGYDLTDDNKKIWDEVNVIEENDTAVALPVGYHTTVALPGTVAYLLWGLAVTKRSTRCSSMSAIPGWRAACTNHKK